MPEHNKQPTQYAEVPSTEHLNSRQRAPQDLQRASASQPLHRTVQPSNNLNSHHSSDDPPRVLPEQQAPRSEDVQDQLDRLKSYRFTLNALLNSRAKLGEAHSPPGVINGIREARENIHRIKQILHKWGVSVADHPDDKPEVLYEATDVQKTLIVEKISASQVTITIDGDIQQFTDVRQRRFILRLSRLLIIEFDQVRVLRIEKGSVKITLEMPESAVDLLIAKYQSQATDLQQLTTIISERSYITGVPDLLEAPRRNNPYRTTTRSYQGLITAFAVIALLGVLLSLLRSMPASMSTTAPTVVATPQPAPTTSAATAVPSETTTNQVSACGESARLPTPDAARFLRSQGVSVFNAQNTNGAVLSDFVRSLAIDERGLWIGYFARDGYPTNGLGHFNKQDWATCNQPAGSLGKDVNAVAVDQAGRIWLATWKHGVLMFDGAIWYNYTRASTNYVLPSDETFSLTIDDVNNVWVGTWGGVAKFDGKSWIVPYTKENGTLLENPVHAIAFDSQQNIWIGHIRSGISLFSKAEGKWTHFSKDTGLPGGNEIRSIVVRKADDKAPESVWFATFDGGVSKFEQGQWTVYNTVNGLPSDEVRGLAIDKHNRVWAATKGGVAYFDGGNWITYTTLDTFSIAFGRNDCSDCAFDGDHIWTGTAAMGLTHSRVPYPDDAIDIVSVDYPKVVAPGQVFTVTITVRPRAPYELREDRGDFLSNTDGSDDLLFGAHEHIRVTGIAASGTTYTFTNYDDRPFIAPQLADGEQEQTYTTTWRVWMHTRYVGSAIPITFTVRR